MLFLPDCSTVIRGAPRLVVSAPRLVVGASRLVVGASRLVVGASRLVVGASRLVVGAPRRSQVHLKGSASVQSTLGFDHHGIMVRQLSDTPSDIITFC